MTTTPATLVAQQDLPNATAILYTSPTVGKGSRIDHALVVNHSGSTRTINVYLVPFGSTAIAVNLVLQTLSLAAGESRVLFEILGRRMSPGDFLSADASAATAVSICVTGVEITG